MFDRISPQAATYLAALLLLLIVRAGEILVLAKRQIQRTKLEQQKVDRGLLRSVVLDVVIFVPASVTLVLLLEPLILPERFRNPEYSQVAVHSLLGTASYGFPFATIRSVVTRVALKTLQEFASITSNP